MKQLSLLFLVGLLASCSGGDKQHKDRLADASAPTAEIATGKETGTIYHASSPEHRIVHDFTYLVAMQDYYSKTLSQMRANSEVDKILSGALEKELLIARGELARSTFKGLKIESGLYEKFLKQIEDRFKDKC